MGCINPGGSKPTNAGGAPPCIFVAEIPPVDSAATTKHLDISERGAQSSAIMLLPCGCFRTLQKDVVWVKNNTIHSLDVYYHVCMIWCTHTHTYIYIHTYIHTLHTNIHVYTCVYMCIHVYTYIHTYKYTCVYMCIHIYIYYSIYGIWDIL